MRIDKIKTNSLMFNAVHSENKNSADKSTTNNRSKLALSLVALATIGLSIVGVKKTAKMTFDEALKKNGVEIKNGIATLIENGEKFTGKIQRFETRNRKETVEFADGLMKEKVYHNLFGRELNGEFYRDGNLKVRVNSYFTKDGQKTFTYYDNGGQFKDCKTMLAQTKDSVFDWARKRALNCDW